MNKFIRTSTICATFILLVVILLINVCATNKQQTISLEDVDICLLKAEFNYTGEAIEPIVFAYNKSQLIEGRDFDVYYFNNVYVGRGYALVIGDGIFSDYVWLGFDIKPNGLAIAKFASSEEFLGLPYVYGGTTKAGFDCSGFVQYIYSQFGIKLNRTASSQANQGVAVSRKDLFPGDLVFFNGNGHVGIYIGDNKFVHSCNRGVVITYLGNDAEVGTYYSDRYCGARRIIY